jgi:hypothetical protein
LRSRKLFNRSQADKMSDAPDNPKPFRLTEGDALGFEGNGVRVPVTWPPTDARESGENLCEADAARVRRETIARFLDWITRGEQSAEFVGRHCIVLAFTLHLPSAPTTQAELAARLGVSKTRAHQIISELKLNAETTDFTGEFEENDHHN